MASGSYDERTPRFGEQNNTYWEGEGFPQIPVMGFVKNTKRRYLVFKPKLLELRILRILELVT